MHQSKLIFLVYIYLFVHPFSQSVEKFVKCSHEREEDKFSNSQIFMKVQSLVNAYYYHLDCYYYFSIIRTLQNSKNFSYLLFTQSFLKVCNDQATAAQSCCFDFFNANFELTRVHYCYTFQSGSSYARNLPKVNGKEIMVASSFAAFSSFLQNLERIIASCSQLYINCQVILLFKKTYTKQAFKTVALYCLYCDTVLVTCFEHIFSFWCVLLFGYVTGQFCVWF